jgi:acetyl esterase/lipase
MKLLLFSLISLQAIPPAHSADELTVRKAIPFATVDGHDLALDLYTPKTAEPAPLIVWVHGGAWRRGSRENVPVQQFAKEGWAIASVSYRLSPVAKFPAQVHDIKAAIRHLRANAQTLGIDATKIVITGESAGAHLAALVGVTNGHAELEGSVGSHPEASSSVQAIVSFFGMSNFMTILQQSTPHGLKVRTEALDLFIGGQPEAVPEVAKLASPVTHVSVGDPPLLLLHGDQDPQAPINQSHELHGAYKAAGLPVEFIVVHGAPHGGPLFYDEERLGAVKRFLETHIRAR